MTNEKRYENIVKMLYDYDRRTGERAADLVLARPEDFLKCPFSEFYACAAALIIEARAGIDKKQTPATVTAAVKRFIKVAKDVAPGISAYNSGFVVLTRFSVLRLNNDISSLPHIDDDGKWPEAQITKLFSAAVDGSTCEPLPLPTVPELKAYIAKCKAIGGKYHGFCIQVGNVYLTPDYLLDFMEALPGCVAYTPKSNCGYIFFKADNGEGILLPCNPKYIKGTVNAGS